MRYPMPSHILRRYEESKRRRRQNDSELIGWSSLALRGLIEKVFAHPLTDVQVVEPIRCLTDAMARLGRILGPLEAKTRKKGLKKALISEKVLVTESDDSDILEFDEGRMKKMLTMALDTSETETKRKIAAWALHMASKYFLSKHIEVVSNLSRKIVGRLRFA